MISLQIFTGWPRPAANGFDGAGPMEQHLMAGPSALRAAGTSGGHPRTPRRTLWRLGACAATTGASGTWTSRPGTWYAPPCADAVRIRAELVDGGRGLGHARTAGSSTERDAIGLDTGVGVIP